MNKKHGGRGAAVLAAALASATCDASAQTQVTPYGIVDIALAHTDHNDAAGNASTKLSTLTGSLPSRFGLRGSEDFGNGIAAVFTLEGGFGPDTGMLGQGGRLFGRQSWVGLKGPWGTVQLGRVPTMTFHALAKSDVVGPNLFSISSIDPYLPNARSDNTVGWLGTFGAVTAGATYSLGRNAAAAGGPSATNCFGEAPRDVQACRQASVLLGYDTGTYGVNASWDKLRGGAGAAGGLTTSDRYDRRVAVNGYAMVKGARVGAGIIARTTNAAGGVVTSNLVYLGASLPLAGPLTLDVQVARRDTKHSPDDTNLVLARLMYALSKRTALHGTIGRMDNRGNAAVPLDAGGAVAAGRAQHGVMAGLRHVF